MTESQFSYDAPTARQIIETVGSHGIPPRLGFETFTVGLDPYLTVIDQDYLSSFIRDGGASFKLVIGAYGGGKTHFLYSVNNLASGRGFVASYVTLSHEENPFHQMERVYSAVIRGLQLPSGGKKNTPATRHSTAPGESEAGGGESKQTETSGEHRRPGRPRKTISPDTSRSGENSGLDHLLRRQVAQWSEQLVAKGLSGAELQEAILEQAVLSTTDLESLGFATAIKEAVAALLMNRDPDYQVILQWLLAIGYERNIHRQFGLLYPVDRSQALTSLRSLTKWIRQLGYPGLVILFDEAEQIPSLSGKQRDIMLSNLRELIDECGHGSLRGTMIFYAVPDETAFEGRTNVYEALKQRLSTIFDFLNPTGVRIRLEDLGIHPKLLLEQIGVKLAAIYRTAYATSFHDEDVHKAAKLLAEAAYDQRFGDVGYKRLFVQTMVRALHTLRIKPDTQLNQTWAKSIMQGTVG